MRLQFTNPATRAFYDHEIMGEHYSPPGISVSKNGVAQVKQEVGEQLVEKYETIEHYE